MNLLFKLDLLDYISLSQWYKHTPLQCFNTGLYSTLDQWQNRFALTWHYSSPLSWKFDRFNFFQSAVSKMSAVRHTNPSWSPGSQSSSEAGEPPDVTCFCQHIFIHLWKTCIRKFNSDSVINPCSLHTDLKEFFLTLKHETNRNLWFASCFLLFFPIWGLTVQLLFQITQLS